MDGVPGVYANVSKALCFIDYATKCTLGQDANLYNIKACPDWPVGRYCELKKELTNMNIELNKVVKAKAKQRVINKAIRKQRVIAIMKTQYEQMIYNCDYPNTPRKDFNIRCR